ncbi:MAG: hypothetical protein BWX84_03160 [Verrucomicrobia bacterium ADurb.Bin118]|jgi:hypothetical protein|nr:MAG: hypothetical protein BWX84_03160 [Verrucomicrobia bacterium ADurb.Bin118]
MHHCIGRLSYAPASTRNRPRQQAPQSRPAGLRDEAGGLEAEMGFFGDDDMVEDAEA